MNNPLKQSLGEFKIDFDRKISDYFDHKIGEQKEPELEELWSNIKSYVLNDGKRLRPYILWRMNNEFRQLERIDDVFIAFELLHNSTLIDDDIIDEHDTRRNRPTLPTTYHSRSYRGNFAALLSANLLRGAGLDLILNSELERDFQRECAVAYQEIGRSIDLAQMLDLEYRRKLGLSKEQYIAQTNLVAAIFIAYMFKLCAPQKYLSDFFEVGQNLGIAFQLADDLMDIDATKQKGRGLGSDIKEGTPTLLSLYAYERLENPDKEKFKALFGKKKLTDDQLQWMITRYEKTNAIRDSKQRVKTYIDNANRILSSLCRAKDHWIIIFGDYILDRKS